MGAGYGVLLHAAGTHRPGFGFHSGPDRLVQPQGAKAAANAYLTYAAAMDEAAVEQAYHNAAAYNLALAEGSEVECPALPEADAVIAVLELPSIGQTLPVFFGVETDVLRHGAGLLPGSSLPIGGAGTHAVSLAAQGSCEQSCSQI